MTAHPNSRRDFIRTSTASVGVAAVIVQTTKTSTANNANSKLRLGFMGVGGRGFGAHVKNLTKLQVEGKPIELVAVCDVYNENRDKAAAHIEKETGRAPAKYEDYLEMIAKEKLDGVTIGTPDHIEGWSAGDHGSVLEEPDYMKLAGPWIDGKARE